MTVAYNTSCPGLKGGHICMYCSAHPMPVMNPEVTGRGTSWMYEPRRSQPSNIWMIPASMITENTRLCWPTAAYLATMPCRMRPRGRSTPQVLCGKWRIPGWMSHAAALTATVTVIGAVGPLIWLGVPATDTRSHTCTSREAHRVHSPASKHIVLYEQHTHAASSAPPKTAAKKPTNMLPYSPASGPRPADVQ
jgi:hypothetical protein